MKSLALRKALLALAVAAVTTMGTLPVVNAQPAPTAAADNSLPPGIDPNSPVAQVIKLTQSGSDISVINAYVANSASPFNLDADTIVTLKDAGVPTDVINAMMNHDRGLGATVAATPQPEPAPAPAPAPVPADTTTAPPDGYAPTTDYTVTDDQPDTAPPPVPVTQEYFDTTLSPYGSWVVVQGYGRCWRPTTVVYDSTWSPYCDRGHWVYTDCGWYWDSDYTWGVTFHYGRWFRDPRIGWCWYPDTVWAPSWVVWRSDNDYCGWAPLPPFAVFTPGVGFYYRGVSVGLDFDFGLNANCFVFLAPGHLCDRRPRSYCVDHTHVTQIFNHTTIINHYDVHNRNIVNTGFPVARVNAHLSRPITQVKIASLPTARREGWQGNVTVRQVTTHTTTERNHTTTTSYGNYRVNGNNGAGNGNYNGNHTVNNTTVIRNNQSSVNNNVRQQPNSTPRIPQQNQYNTRVTTQTTPPNYNTYNNNNARYDSRVTTAPPQTTTTPSERYNTERYNNNSWQQEPQQRAQQTEVHSTYSGGYESRNNNNSDRGQSYERSQSSQGQGQGQSQSRGESQNQGQGQGQGNGSGQGRQNH